jgi:HEAT repeat protein
VRWAAAALLAALLATVLAGCRSGARGDLESPDPGRRAAAVVRLGSSTDAEALAALLVAQHDPDPRVRKAAARAFGARGGASSQEGLAAMLGDPDPEVLAAAARALGAIRPEGPGTDARAAAELQRRAGVALAGAYGRADARGRAEIAEALRAIGGSLRDAVEAEARWLWDRNARNLAAPGGGGRAGAAEELGRSGRAESVRTLLPLLEESDGDPQLAEAIVRGLGWSGSGDAVVASLEVELKSRWAGVAEGAAWSLGNLGDPRGAESLAEIGSGGPARVARAAAAALDALPPAPEVGVAMCEVAVRSTDPSVAARAAAGSRAREVDCPERPLTQRIARGGPDAVAALAAFGALGLRGDRLKGPGDRVLSLFQSSADPRLRSAAARSLGSASHAAAVPVLQRRASAILEKGARTSGTVDPRSAAQPADADELGEVAVALARLAPDSGAPLALRLASDPDARLRAAAARALGFARSPTAAESLALLTGDADPSVRRDAVASLGLLGKPGLAPLSAALASRSGDEEEALEMTRALAATGDAGAVPLLARMLAGPQGAAAAAALGRLGSVSGVPVLLAWMESGQGAGRVEAIESLGALGAPEAGEPLSRELTSDRPEVRAAAARALGRLRHEAAAGRLEALRADYYADVRRAAVEALARLPTRAPARR